MDLDGSKQVCGICKNWKGKREWVDNKARVKPSAKGLCQRLKKVKPPHGGCDQWEKWEGEKS
jgi:hypothetical protein